MSISVQTIKMMKDIVTCVLSQQKINLSQFRAYFFDVIHVVKNKLMAVFYGLYSFFKTGSLYNAIPGI